MPFMETFSLATVKQSPAPQHHSPAALRNPPRLIQVSCADASEPIATKVPTKPTSATDRGVMTVPPRAKRLTLVAVPGPRTSAGFRIGVGRRLFEPELQTCRRVGVL